MQDIKNHCKIWLGKVYLKSAEYIQENAAKHFFQAGGFSRKREIGSIREQTKNQFIFCWIRWFLALVFFCKAPYIYIHEVKIVPESGFWANFGPNSRVRVTFLTHVYIRGGQMQRNKAKKSPNDKSVTHFLYRLTWLDPTVTLHLYTHPLFRDLILSPNKEWGKPWSQMWLNIPGIIDCSCIYIATELLLSVAADVGSNKGCRNTIHRHQS